MFSSKNDEWLLDRAGFRAVNDIVGYMAGESEERVEHGCECVLQGRV